jgi:hypothetical protein
LRAETLQKCGYNVGLSIDLNNVGHGFLRMP